MASSAPISIADIDVYSVGPAHPTHAPPPLLPDGVRAYGARLPRAQFSIQVPATIEDLLSVQLQASMAATVTMDRTYSHEAVAGDAVVLPHGEPGRWDFKASEHTEFLLLAFPAQFLQAVAEREFEGSPYAVELRLSLAAQRDPLLYGIAWELRRQLQVPDFPDMLYVESLLNTAAMHLLRHYATSKPRVHEAPRCLLPRALHSMCDYIEANLNQPLTLEELGGVAQYSPCHLERLFRIATGQTLHRYVILRRLAKAKLLLTTTDLPLHQVAALAGFSDQSQLSKQYRREYGFAPSAERR
jgi:AraC family transcriptional regulator